MIASWFHRVVLRHHQDRRRVTVPMHDMSTGVLVECECGKDWAL